MQFTSKTVFAAASLLIVVVMTTTFPARVAADRSFYAPGPFNYPGLLPRFRGDGNNNAAGAAGAEASSASGRQPVDDDSLGTRFGERDDDRNQRLRPSGSSSPSSRCPPARVPCFDCIVYISRTGEITRYNAARQNELAPY